jgi:hypothetical protein
MTGRSSPGADASSSLTGARRCVYWIVSYPKAFPDQYARAHTRAGLLLQVQEMIAGEGEACAARNARTRPHHGVLILLIPLPDQRG